ncbi:MAG: hypothetical protein JWM67_903 [Mycobacterium sp.]|nr:hypothetical protein [Mycobacterium sp.]
MSSPTEGWDRAPAGLLVLAPDGTVAEANLLLLEWLGRDRGDVVGRTRLPALLSVGGRIYWETHLAPLLHVEGRLDEVALELVVPGGRLPVLLSAVVVPGAEPAATRVHVALSTTRERARYERELLAARAAAERLAAQVQALQDVTAALSRAVGVRGVVDALLAAVARLGSASGGVWLSDPERGLQLAAGAGPAPTEAALRERATLAPDGSAVVPLAGRAGLRGALVFSAVGPAGEPPDLDVLTSVGQQGGVALDRALQYEQRSTIAHQLQHSLIATDPPRDPRFAVAATYRPGVELLEVGGDWYDVFAPGGAPTAEGSRDLLSVVVGDVVGRGLGAAIAMGQLRSAVRAVAGPGVGPGRLLSELDRFVEHVEAAGMATVAYAQLDLATGVLRYACAGHPPPVLLPARGEPRLLWGGRSTPLGAFEHRQPRAEAEVRLRPGDRLLLYTDGLVERRDRSLDDSFELLRTSAGDPPATPLEDSVGDLTRALLEDEQSRDDVCVLLLRWRTAPFERHLSADLAEVAPMRAQLGRWLGQNGAEPRACADVVLAVSEAVANAVEHGCGGRPDLQIRVRASVAELADGTPTVTVEVRDPGTWRPPSASPERGRGLTIMTALMDRLQRETTEGTTVVLHHRLRREAS